MLANISQAKHKGKDLSTKKKQKEKEGSRNTSQAFKMVQLPTVTLHDENRQVKAQKRV